MIKPLGDQPNPSPSPGEGRRLVDIVDGIPFMGFIVDEDLRILLWNRTAEAKLPQEDLQNSRSGDVLRCVHALESPAGCGRSESCQTCVVRSAVREAFQGKQVARQRILIERALDDSNQGLPILITASPIEHDGRRYCLLIFEDIRDDR
ncbi:MAG: PAS domain-containing protein [Elusimicrobia bacterium]|nr:PAS domain-containing protein [Elusimicrobiota bacterium]